MKKIYESPEWELVKFTLTESLLQASTLPEGGQHEDDPGNESGGGFG